ncbi:hypothetical protein FOA52_006177 [Chlamydomonas sp. UWO 241]|nr:hypothetical protein FOA52_006177 [Chlamydomonas sp. UWO 241]
MPPAVGGPDQGGIPPGGAQAAAAASQGSWWSTILRFAFMWAFMSYMKSGTAPSGAEETKNPIAAPTPGSVVPGAVGMHLPMFRKGDVLDLYCFLTEEQHVTDYAAHMHELIWSEAGLPLGMEMEQRNTTYLYTPSEAVQSHNGSVYLHVVFAKAGMPIDSSDPDYKEFDVFGSVHNLIGWYPRPKNATGVSLLSGDALPEAPTAEEKAARLEVVPFFKPNVTVQLVDHFVAYPKAKGIPPQFGEFMSYTPSGNYYPIIYFNEFWLLRDKMIAMNDTVVEINLTVEAGPVSLWWWQIMVSMEKSFKMQRGMGLQGDGESDEFKRVLLEGNPILLAVTFCVSMLHTVFDMLAFKNDIGFWKDNKSMEGLSARSVIINAVCQLIILCYLLDNETSMVILFSSVLGVGIEFWKVTKAMKVSVINTFPYVKFEDRASYAGNKTKQYDEEATRYLSWVLYPLITIYAIYSLMYKTHKSWYSWVVNSLVGAVYMFGFILMCPQLYLNYKLKSVAHLPWRQMTYKFLNTIIDDLFAFVIKMPLLHRLSVFRDDLIFVIFLYQRWIYRVDNTRVNEFGFSGAAQPEAVADAGAAALEGAAKEGDTDEPPKAIKGAAAAVSAAGAGEDSPAAGGAKKRKGGKGKGAAEAVGADAGEGSKKGK